jgi:carbonic anhydrase/acetyltransferase-like protein (isoleucine patch superfamily)
MIIEHLGKKPDIHPSVYVAPNAVVCGDVEIGMGARIMFGVSVIAEGGRIRIGANTVVLENAVIRSTAKHSTRIGTHTLIGPNAHVVGCGIEDSVFIATGASVFHGASVGRGSEVRINGVVHIKTKLSPGSTVPIGWIAVGNPAQLFPPDKHAKIWEVQEPLNFPEFVYGIERVPEMETLMPSIAVLYHKQLGTHKEDKILKT